MKRYSILSAIRMQIKITVGYHHQYIPIRMARGEELTIPKTGEKEEQQEFSFVNGTATLENSLSVSYIIRHTRII